MHACSDKKVRTVPRRKAEVAPSQPPRSPSPELSSTLETVFSPAAQQFVKTVSGIPNVILQSLIQAADPDSCIAKGSPIPDEPTPNPEVMRELIQLYLRYSHPIHRIVNDQDPDFWPRLYDRLTPEAASIVYAMCTVGALYRNRPPGAENLDEMVGYFYRRTIAVHETRSEDIISIQTMLILQNFLVITLRSEECAKFLGRMLKIANDIRLAETVQKIASQPTMSPEDVVVRNTWRLLIWTEIMGNMLSLNNGPVDPMKDLTNAYLDARPEEMPSSKLSSGEIAYYHFGCLLKIFQSITRIRLPMSAGYLYPVTTTLDALANWHNSLPKHMRVNPRTGGAAALSSHASNLDLYYRLGHIVLLNNLPQSVRSSSTGLGPRRDSPLRMLATFANGITATVGDIVMEPDLRNFSIIIGMRCLTEAATIQTANSKEPDPAISTPAKVNLMKTLWCIRQFNFAVTSKAIGGILTSFDLAAKQASVPQTANTLVCLQTAIPTDSPTLPGPSHNRREHSLASDYTSSTASTRERSYMTSYEIDDAGNPDKERPSRDSATAPTVTLESPITGQHRSNIPMPGSTSQSAGGVTDSSTKTNHRVVDGDRSRSSPVLMFSPKLESPGGAASTATSGSRSPMPPPPQATYDRSQSNTQYGQDHNQPYHSRRAPETIPQRHYLDGHGSSQTNEHVSNPRASAWPQPHRSDGTDGQDYFDSSHQQQHNQIKRPTGPQPPHLSTATLPPNSSHPYQQSSHTPLSDASDIGAHHHGFSTGYSRPSSSPSTSSHGNYSRPPRSNRVEIDPYMDSAGASTLPMTQPDTEYTSPQQSTSRPGQAQGQTQGQTQGQAPSGTDSAFHSSRPITRPEYSSSDYSHGHKEQITIMGTF
ncbi:hypothetical protein BCR41DRAFT_367422 [Lobosporangium transversale]|uniref:Xylanolytic transcriptional activator regulatory domain-containing protein n=1 Tax=Lobosporangium transversale TaxID=64571 RepID=A0A1Y2GZY5_9FUNG|nr:hypothetical protein BCR41DRAFT_367422 [Lobosporangium transversale]ORZ27869.1 hypothetical protein BCR41DRAFT_367422 [Lobosporangium transversale]|eukprot:XP_021885572.1 hypothetical protein BCR41DRAFT_367422 [Lobosporangium transversale]